MVACRHCATLWEDVKAHDRCGRCGAPLHMRKPDSLNRTWAFLIAACIMYVPANILPVMTTAPFLGKEQQDTILSGIIYFWNSGSWVLALIVFTASFLVPLFKLTVVTLLLISVHGHSKRHPLLRARLYRLVAVIGRWSMLDVFVVTLMTGLIQIKGFATVHPGRGIAAFAAVVVLTMLASISFDPRLMWDVTEHEPETPMNQDEAGDTAENIPLPEKVRPRDLVPLLIWLIPILAAAIGVWLVVQTWVQQGPEITITFSSGEGLEAGKTKVRYKEVEIGTVKSITLSEDHTHVLVTVQLKKEAKGFTAADSRFWVVRPFISLSRISGLSTLLFGSYIGADAGIEAEKKDTFTGLEASPLFTRDVSGKQYVLHATDLGSLDIGAPVYYRRIKVGQVTAFDLSDDGKGITTRIFINAPYDKFVGINTRFWHASGFDIQVNAEWLQA